MSSQVELVDTGRCALCMAKIDEDGLGVDGATYHENCFKCLKCSVELSNENFGEIGILGPVCKDHVKKKNDNAPTHEGDAPTHVDDAPTDEKNTEKEVDLKTETPIRPTIDVNEANSASVNTQRKIELTDSGDEETEGSDEMVSVFSPTSGEKKVFVRAKPRSSQVFAPATPNLGDRVDTPLFDAVDQRLKGWESYDTKEEVELNKARYEKKKKLISEIPLYSKKPYRFDDAQQCRTCTKWVRYQDLEHHAEAHPTLIYPRIYLGDELDAQRRDELDHIGVKHVLNVADYCGPYHKEHFNYLHLHIDDIPKQDIRPFFDEVFAFLDAALKDPESGSVLVHCIMGVSRSAALCIAYIMRENKWSLSKVINDVSSARHCVNPNYGFLTQLVEYDIELNGSSDFRIDKWRRQNEDNWK